MSITIEEVYPEATEEEREEARKKLDLLVEILWSIAKRRAAEIDEEQSPAYPEDGRIITRPND